MVIRTRCPVCKNHKDLILSADEMASYDKWLNGTLIQEAFPHWSSEKRELLKTGICKECWPKLFGGKYAKH